ncbi:MAG: recombination-associated protein RdgC [Rubrivivax sp.]|nr:recombination-associated protein RdgC [Rubrivivax sp.]
MFKNALVYHIEQWDPPTRAEIEQRLERMRFVPCSPAQPESAGWVAPRGEQHAALLESVAGQLVLKLCTETRPVPAGAVKEQLQARLDRIEAETGRRPKGKAARELKEQVVHELRPRAFSKRSTTAVWLDLEARRVLVGAGSAKKADAVTTQLVALFGGLRLAPLQTALSPATAMAAWLSEKQAPSGFSIDRECELKQPDSEKATVRYARHTLDIDELGEHIRQGKLPTQLAMTWNGRVSFVLTEALALKKIKLLDGVLEGSSPGDGAEDGFDADVAIATGELQRLLPDLIDALGGPLVKEAAPPARAETTSADTPPWETAAA